MTYTSKEYQIEEIMPDGRLSLLQDEITSLKGARMLRDWFADGKHPLQIVRKVSNVTLTVVK